MSQNILFFSDKCKTCNLFMTTCQKNNILKYFKLIDVNGKSAELANKGLKIVPTIIIKGHNNPIEGKDVFNWLKTVIGEQVSAPVVQRQTNPNNNPVLPDTNVVKRTSMISSKNAVTKITPPSPLKEPPVKKTNGSDQGTNDPDSKLILGGRPVGYLQEEMNGFSDTFALLADDDIIQKSFLNVNNCNNEFTIYTPPSDDRLNEKRQKMLLKSIEIGRESDKNIFIKNMDAEHKLAIQSHKK